jgi:urea transporter
VPQITSAKPSRNEELRHRELRYGLMMGFRVVCLVLATVLVTAHVKYTVYWAPSLIFGAVLIPWFAVILANDHGPRNRHGYVPPAPTKPEQRVLTAAEPDEGPRTIDVDYEP